MPEVDDDDVLQDPDFLTSFWFDVRDVESHWEGMWQKQPEQGQKMRKTLSAVVAALEGMTKPDWAKVEDSRRKYPEMWSWLVDWWYCKEAVEKIPHLKRRFLALTPVIVGTPPSNLEVKVYIREATRCYLYGFFQASVTLSRAALETALDDCLEQKLGTKPSAQLAQKIDQAARWKFISAAVCHRAHLVRKTANGVLHEKQVSEAIALARLDDARSTLRELYRF